MGKFVLVIDDSPTVCKIIEVCLHREGYEVKCCSDGLQALQWLKSQTAHLPDLIFVDLCLPKMDGYRLIQYLRPQPAFHQTTFAIISRRNSIVDKLKGRIVGANVYLTKPLTTGELLSVAKTHLGIPNPS